MPDSRPFPFIVDSTSYPASNKDKISEKTIKTKIVLHFTAGTTGSGAISTLLKYNFIMVHFLIDENGKIFQFMPIENAWAYSMGIIGLPKGQQEKIAISIETVSPGPLVLRENKKLCFWPDNFNTFYCSINDTDKYVELESPWRGYTYFSTFSPIQYLQLGKLCGWLCMLESIPPEIIFTNWETDIPKAAAFNGIIFHSTVRRDKFDLSPSTNFDYLSTLIATAAEYYNDHSQEYENPVIL